MEFVGSALLGGMLIGLAAGLAMIGLGRIAGVSGITAAVVIERQAGWQRWFLFGLLGTALLISLLPLSVRYVSNTPWWLLIVAGLLVGMGTRLGNGCTSGHGICGLARFSPRSLMAVLTFMAAGVLVATLLRPFLLNLL